MTHHGSVIRTFRGSQRRTATHPNPYLPATARVMRTVELDADVRLYDLRFDDSGLAQTFTYLPGQFVELSILGVGEGPFSLPSSPTRPGFFQLGIRRVGVLTSFLFDHVREGDAVGIRGPLGNGFPVDRLDGNDVLLIAGGLGIMPIRGLLQYLVDLRDRFRRVVLLYGARTPDRILFADELAAIRRRGDVDVVLTVDDPAGMPWSGQTGTVTDRVNDVRPDGDRTVAIACGPPAFYRSLLDTLVDVGFGKDRIFLSLERRMECGVGKCGHCAVGYTFTCLHGPVFSYWDAINLPELIDA